MRFCFKLTLCGQTDDNRIGFFVSSWLLSTTFNERRHAQNQQVMPHFQEAQRDVEMSGLPEEKDLFGAVTHI